MATSGARDLLESVKGPFPDALQRLEAASRAIPEDTDFHFYCNYPQFKRPLQNVVARVEKLLNLLGTAREVRHNPAPFVDDPEEVYDWLTGVQDDCLEKVDSALDEFHKARNESKRRKGPDFDEVSVGKTRNSGETSLQETAKRVKMAKRSKDNSVPTYIASIPRPQDKFDAGVDNSSTPFKHPRVGRVEGGSVGTPTPVSLTFLDTGLDEVKAGSPETASVGTPNAALQRCEKYAHKLRGSTAVHPLEERLRSLEFTDEVLVKVDSKEPLPLAVTPLTVVDTLSALQELAAKLRTAEEIAVDLENHSYRSFQGFVCIMQVSTRSEDFIVDTLTLRSHIGPCLGEIFSDSRVRKVMHGADSDVVWLQRDFGIYLCNLFDTGQASRVLNFPSFSLAFLLQHFCNIAADKRYQLADWRLRPLPADMLRYAREDTHYLLYIYDKLRQLLLLAGAGSSEQPNEESPLLQVFHRSRDVCLKLYEKDLLTDDSHLQIYGMREKQFRPLQLGVLKELYAWRDQLARKEDESTGFVCPNKHLIQLAEEMPETMQELNKVLKGSKCLAHEHRGTLLSIIRSTKQEFLSKIDIVDGEGKLEGEKDADMVSNILVNSTPIRQNTVPLVQDKEGAIQKLATVPAVEPVEFPVAEVSIPETASMLDVKGEHPEEAPGTNVGSSGRSLESNMVAGGAVVRRAMTSSLFGPSTRSSGARRRALSLEELTRRGDEGPPSQMSSPLPSHLNNDVREVTQNVSTIRETSDRNVEGENSAPPACCALDSQDRSAAEVTHSGVHGDSAEKIVVSGISICSEILVSEEKTTPDDIGASNASCLPSRSQQELSGHENLQIHPEVISALPISSHHPGGGTEDANAKTLAVSGTQTGEGETSAGPSLTSESNRSKSLEGGTSIPTDTPVGMEGTGVPNRNGGLASLLGRPQKKKDASRNHEEDPELVEARRKADQVKSSVTLPFHGVSGVHVPDGMPSTSTSIFQAAVRDKSSLTVLERLGVKLKDKNEAVYQETKAWSEVISFEQANNRAQTVEQEGGEQKKRRHKSWFEKVSDTAQASGDRAIPISLSEARRLSRAGTDVPSSGEAKKAPQRFDTNSFKRRKVAGVPSSASVGPSSSGQKKKKSQRPGLHPASAPGGAAIPFDYEAAKSALDIEKQLKESRAQREESSRGRPGSKRKRPDRPDALRTFNPYRPTGEPKAEGIRPGPRRQVFPQSGNRSATFR